MPSRFVWRDSLKITNFQFTVRRSNAVAIMSEIGSGISAHCSNRSDEFVCQNFDYIITACSDAKETYLVFPVMKELITQLVRDLRDENIGNDESHLAIFRRARDEIHVWLKQYAPEGTAQSENRR